MSKKIGIKIKDSDNLEFVLKEDAKAGDYICAKDVQTIDLSSLEKYFKEKNEEQRRSIRDEILRTEKNNIINEFKASNEYKNLIIENTNLTNKIKNQEEELNSKFKYEIDNLKNKLIMKDKEFLLEKEKLSIDLNHKHQVELKKLKDENDELKRYKTSLSTKALGEEFEDHLSNEINNAFAAMENVILEKANKIIYGSKPDFIFIIKDDSENECKVVIEAKTKLHHGSKKNRDFFDKLDRDCDNNNGEYSILVTELETDQEFYIQKIKNYNNMFMVRPQFLIALLNVITIITLKKFKLQNEIREEQIQFKEKQDILQSFEEFKNNILDNSLKNIENKVGEIIKESETIKKAANKIEDAANTILNKHKKTIENKINDFNIQNKIIKKIEKLEMNINQKNNKKPIVKEKIN